MHRTDALVVHRPRCAPFRSLWLAVVATLSLALGGHPPAMYAAEAPAKSAKVSVAAASDLKFAFDEIAAAFQKENPTIAVVPTYGSSGTFFAQLTNRAPFDLYLSADIEYPRKLIAQGQAVKDSEFRYAIGQIVVWLPTASKLDVAKTGIEALLDASVRKIAIANPQHAPYGRAAEAALKKLGVYDKVKDKLVLGENIAQTAQFVQSGAADLGIIALSRALAPPMKEAGRYWPVPLDSYPPIEQGGVILSWASDPAAAALVRAYMSGPEARAILTRYGFALP